MTDVLFELVGFRSFALKVRLQNLELALPRLGQSMIGQGVNALKSTTRTSKTAWLKRTTSPALDHVIPSF